MKKISTFLRQPYPFYYDSKSKGVIAGLLFLMTLIFGYLFEPFNVYHPEHKMSYFWITFIHGLTPAFVVGIFSTIRTSVKSEERWNVGKEVLLIALFLLLVGIIQFLIRDLIYNNANNWSWQYLYEEIRNTFLVGMLFAFILIPLNFIRLTTKNTRKAKDINASSDTNPLDVLSENLGVEEVLVDGFRLEISHFLFAKAEENYMELNLTGEGTSKVLKRITFKELESLLKPHANVIKTHRSYLVNMHYIKNVMGNAQGYRLQLEHCEEVVPVSRKMIPHFEKSLNRK